MSYLIPAEFKRFIQVDNLNQIINNDQTILVNAILDAQAMARENLVQKYMIDQELTDFLVYDPSATYVPGDRIYLDAPTYSGATAYSLNDLVSKDGNVYIAPGIVGPETWNVSHWTLLGPQYAMYYVPYPNNLFNYNIIYSIGDIVFWNGKNYTALIATQQIDHETQLQARVYAQLPINNIFPDDPVYGVQYWGTGTPVSIIPGSFPIGFTNGDNRDRTLVRKLIQITLYIIFPRISPRNIPTFIESQYHEAIRWLKEARDGDITTSIALIQPRAGGRTRWGSNIKQINSY